MWFKTRTDLGESAAYNIKGTLNARALNQKKTGIKFWDYIDSLDYCP